MAPGAALAAVAEPQVAGMAATPTYLSVVTHLDGRTITLWTNTHTAQWHAEISDAATGDRIQLDYTDSQIKEVPGKYMTDTVGVASDESFANTSDHTDIWFRACGFVGSVSACTGWYTG